MSGMGHHIGLDEDQLSAVTSCQDENQLLDLVNEMVDDMDDGENPRFYAEYKDWDVLHRCLSDGTFDPKGGTYPLNRCYIGGRLLHSEASIINLVPPNEARDVASALAAMDKNWFRQRFIEVWLKHYHDPDLDSPPDAGVVRRFWSWLSGKGPNQVLERKCQEYWDRIGSLKAFYTRMAKEGRAIVFYTDDPLSYFGR